MPDDTRAPFEYTTEAGVHVQGSVHHLKRTNQRVWAITTFRRTLDPGERFLGSRTVGLFKRCSAALRILARDLGDLDEAGYYQYAVIEPLPLGLYPVNDARDRIWFEHNRETDTWERLPGEPEVLTAVYRRMGAGGVGSWATVG